MDFRKYLPTASDVLALEPEELAGFLLEHFNEGAGDDLNRNNVSLMLDQMYCGDEVVPNAFMYNW